MNARFVIGVDEAGRGPWAGPVMAGAVILDPARPVEGLRDSKKLSQIQRDRLAPIIRQSALGWAVAEASVGEIDTLNIRQASLLAMKRAVNAVLAGLTGKGIAVRTDEIIILIDGNALPEGLPGPAEPRIRGDETEPVISAASILAKTERDRIMTGLCSLHPGYGFSSHKGYGTPEHAGALERLGPCPAHRRSFAPVKAVLDAFDSPRSSQAREAD